MAIVVDGGSADPRRFRSKQLGAGQSQRFGNNFKPSYFASKPHHRLSSNKWERQSHGDGANPQRSSPPCRPTTKQHNGVPSKKYKWERRNTTHDGGDAPNPKPNPNPIPAEETCPSSTSNKSTKTKVCRFWKQGKCSNGDKCKYLHQWFNSQCFTMLNQLPGHDKAITAIVLPSGSDKLLSASKDESLKIWDCHTGQCAAVIKTDGPVGCMIDESPWIFIGIPNAVKAWNVKTNADLTLTGPVGQVYALVVGNQMLFSGNQDGKILAWRFCSNNTTTTLSDFEQAACLKGHTLGVISLTIGNKWLYSGSMDTTIRVWDLETLGCIYHLTGHTSAVTSVLCWDHYLLSSSLDCTVMVWGMTEKGNFEVTYTHKEEHGVVVLGGMKDPLDKPVLACSCNDNTLHLYDLPSFNPRGQIFSKEEIRAGDTGPQGLFFTGDGAGELRVWKWSELATA